MFVSIRRLLGQFFSRSSTIDNEPLNKASLIVIIAIDLFIVINVFTGLDDISQWYMSPTQAYPCYAQWVDYQQQTPKNRDYDTVRLSLSDNSIPQTSFRKSYQQAEEEHLGNVSPTCLQYGDYQDKVNNAENRQLIKNIDRKQTEISRLEQANRDIRAQYDSSLLEKIAGQSRDRSINSVAAEKAKQELEQNNRKISTLKKDIVNLKSELLSKPENVSFLSFLNNKKTFQKLEKSYQNASFWYPSIQLAFQSFFLVPLILAALLVHNFAQRRRYGLISVISWHLLVIFFVPLILKIFQFLQIGAILQFIVDIIGFLFGGLLFIISYVYILLIPLIGFGIIKFFQKVVFNPKSQIANRVQKSRCIRCAKKIRDRDNYCAHCGYYQYVECPNCHNLTYKYLPYCKQCGVSQE